MRRLRTFAAFAVFGLVIAGAAGQSNATSSESFGAAVKAVQRYSPLVVLTSPDGQASVAVWPAMQGRVLTSTAEGPAGLSFGWINHDLMRRCDGKPGQAVRAS